MTPRQSRPTRDVAEIPTWSGPLVALGDVLRKEALELRGKTAARILRGGALVSARVTSEGMQFRIARDTRPSGVAALAKWEMELATFAAHLKLEGWTRSDEYRNGGVAAVFTAVAGVRRRA